MTSILAGLTHDERLALRRELAVQAVQMGVNLNNSGSTPTALAMRHDPLIVERAHTRAIDRVLCGLVTNPQGRVMIFSPPQLGKSSAVARRFPFWWLTQFPRARIGLGSYAASLAQTHGAAVREMIRMYGGEYGLVLSPHQATKSAWELTTGGGLRSVGVRSGFSGQPVDLALIDDPFAGRAEAESTVMRNAVWDWYSSVWSARRQPETREAIVMTRWHKDDLAGRLLDQDGRVEEGGEWTVLHMPAIALAPDPDRGIWEDPLGREPGEPISHPKIGEGDNERLLAHWKAQRSRSTDRDWNALYLGVPFSAQGALLSDQDLRNATASHVPEKWSRIAVGVDPSGGGRDSAGIVVAAVSDGKVWFVEDRTARMSSIDWPREVCLAAHDHGADRVVIETNYGGDQATTLVTQAWDNLAAEGKVTGPCPYVAPVTSKRSKVLRAEPIAQAIKTGRILFAPGNELKQLRTEWQMWEPGSTWSPGALDAGVHVATDLLPQLRTGTVNNPAAKSRSGGTRSALANRRR